MTDSFCGLCEDCHLGKQDFHEAIEKQGRQEGSGNRAPGLSGCGKVWLSRLSNESQT
jgi:hypothetical protein